MRKLRCFFFPLFCAHAVVVRFDAENRMWSAPQCNGCGKLGNFQPHHRVKKGYEGAAATALIETLRAGEEP